MRRFIPVIPLLLTSTAMLLPRAAHAQIAVGVSITVVPSVLVVYAQPPVPAPGYIWTPGYWAWGPVGYYWVPGTWVTPPQPGLLWTPGYWAWNAGAYVWNPGYWGPHVGFYGGINYGFGYGGIGYQGGYWNRAVFAYNRAVNNFGSVHITNVYNKTVVNNVTVNNVSYNGGAGGIAARPTPEQLAVAHEAHMAPTPAQMQHVQAASANRQLLASVNHGAPPFAATARPGDFTHAVVPARPMAAVAVPGGARPGVPGAGHGVPGPHAPEEAVARPAEARPMGQPGSVPPGHAEQAAITRSAQSVPHPVAHPGPAMTRPIPAAAHFAGPRPAPRPVAAPRPAPHPAARPEERRQP